MSDMKVECKEFAENMKKLIDGFKYATSTEVVVGIPAESNGGHAGGMTNAALLYLHCNGSPANHIPARPVLELGIHDPEKKPVLEQLMKQGLEQAFAGNVDAASACYEKAGMAGASAVQSKFGSGDIAENKPSTIARKHSSRPLIDKGSLRSSITYAVRKKK